jgi:hypothetical protein
MLAQALLQLPFPAIKRVAEVRADEQQDDIGLIQRSADYVIALGSWDDHSIGPGVNQFLILQWREMAFQLLFVLLIAMRVTNEYLGSHILLSVVDPRKLMLLGKVDYTESAKSDYLRVCNQ